MASYLTLTTALMAYRTPRRSKGEQGETDPLTPMGWAATPNATDHDQKHFYSPIQYNPGDHLSIMDKCQDLALYKKHIGKCKRCQQKPRPFEEIFGYQLNTDKMDKQRGWTKKISKFGKRLYSWLKPN